MAISDAKNMEFDKLVEKYANTMFRCAYSYCQNRMDAEDVIQEVFLKYLKKKPKFIDENHEKAWLLRVTINVSKDYIKSFGYKKTQSLNDDIPLIDKEKSDVWEAVSGLPPKYRIVIQLYYQENYSIKEISKLLKVKESTIGTQLGRAKEKLKRLMKEE